jgi:hypothetical protein
MMYSPEERRAMIDRIRSLPADLEACISGLTDEQLTTHFLEDEWTVAQNVHHIADSHMNSYIRFKLILAEDHPPLKPYDQDAWADMPDATRAAVSSSLALLHGLHARWTTMLDRLSNEDWSRTGHHPEHGDQTLDDMLELYARHGHGHIAQITKTLAAQKPG